jgi:hypothetical protein
MGWDPITDEGDFMDADSWGETNNGNPICTVDMGGDEFTVVIYPYQGTEKYGYLIFSGDEKTWTKQRYNSIEEARAGAWLRLELMT